MCIYIYVYIYIYAHIYKCIYAQEKPNTKFDNKDHPAGPETGTIRCTAVTRDWRVVAEKLTECTSNKSPLKPFFGSKSIEKW